MKAISNRTNNKLSQVSELLNDLKKSEFTGYIRISFSQGGITKVEKNEDILRQIKLSV